MMSIRAYCRIPEIRKNSHRSKEGSCPQLLYDYIDELKYASEIHIAIYLFNNEILLDALEKLAAEGCKVHITTLPPNGYSEKKLKVEGFQEKISGRDLAVACYSRIKKNKLIRLKFFPHQYMWYGALYAGGGASYSFHIKVAFVKFKKRRTKCFIGSGNFMVTDPDHSDNYVIIENEKEYTQAFEKFFLDLEKYSIDATKFPKKCPTMKEEFLYTFSGNEISLNPSSYQNCFFAAPFYLYGTQGSNHFAGNRIISLINKAKKRIWICSQHFHDLISFDPARETIIGELYKKTKLKNKINFKFLKQVPHSSLADKRRAGIAETLFQFVMQADQRVNRLVHDKFMIIDNILLVSTGNFTPSQFAFGQRKMTYEESLKGKKIKIKKDDNFSEVNGYVIFKKNASLLKKFEKHFLTLWDLSQDIELEL